MPTTKGSGLANQVGANAVAPFEQHRSLLLGLAYRLLGSMWDAEDVVQEAYVRWTRTDPSAIRQPRAFLITVVSRLALDQLKSARASRETYVGTWLPEPVATARLGPLDTTELRDTVSYATLHLMERLSPPERAVFVLREAFELPYTDIAEIIGNSVQSCRQVHSRARRRLGDGADRFHPSRADHSRLLDGFLQAATSGDLSGLREVLSDDVTAWTDGGGKVRAALRPVTGRVKVLAFLTGLISRYTVEQGRIADVNDEPAIAITVDGSERFVTLDVRGGLIHGIYAVVNPDKLTHLHTCK